MKNTEYVPRLPQVRVLLALLPRNPEYPVSEWPILTHAALNRRCGYSPISTGVTRPMRGIRVGSSSLGKNGTAYPGLIELGYVEVVKLNIDGVVEDNYRITREGIAALGRYVMTGGKMPQDIGELDSSVHINKRYKKVEDKEPEPVTS